jgi:MoxR-like ATPase
MSAAAIPYYEPGRRVHDEDDVAWKRAIRKPEDHPRHYIAEEGLKHAVEIALYLRQPLLLTGEPGTGKTQLGYSVAWELGMPPPLRFNTKSVTMARDLFYAFDALARLRDAQLKNTIVWARSDGTVKPGPPFALSTVADALPGCAHSTSDADVFESRKYLTLRPLGEAIVRARIEDQDLAWLPPVWAHLAHEERRRSVVIIDEIDKAARDVPNDILDEVEQFRFQIPEVNNVVISADQEFSPFLVFTSNSEKNLPDAFLRRCVYHHIDFPSKAILQEIIAGRIASEAAKKTPLVVDAVELFMKLRASGTGIRKAPGTAELLNWIRVLRNSGLSDERPLITRSGEVRKSLGVLIKTREDLLLALDLLTTWEKGQTH